MKKDYTSFRRYFSDLLLPFIILIICGYSFVYYSLFKFQSDYHLGLL